MHTRALQTGTSVWTEVENAGWLHARSAVSIFDSESIIFNLSVGICVMKADANSNKREKSNDTTASVKKSRSKSLR